MCAFISSLWSQFHRTQNSAANNKKAILAAEDLNKKHEQKHLKLATDICAREFPKAQKALAGKTQDDVDDAIDAIKKLIDDAYEDLDKKEGMTQVTPNSNGSFTVKQVGIWGRRDLKPKE